MSVIATLILKFATFERSCLTVINSRISGWSTRRMPMLAPRTLLLRLRGARSFLPGSHPFGVRSDYIIRADRRYPFFVAAITFRTDTFAEQLCGLCPGRPLPEGPCLALVGCTWGSTQALRVRGNP